MERVERGGIPKKGAEGMIKSSWKSFNWFFWPLLYLFATINGHIYRFVELGLITRESGLSMVAAAQYDILPILMTLLVYSKLSQFHSKKKSVVIASMGLLMSNYFFRIIPFEASYVWYCVVIGALIYGIFWYFKSKALKEIQLERV